MFLSQDFRVRGRLWLFVVCLPEIVLLHSLSGAPRYLQRKFFEMANRSSWELWALSRSQDSPTHLRRVKIDSHRPSLQHLQAQAHSVLPHPHSSQWSSHPYQTLTFVVDPCDLCLSMVILFYLHACFCSLTFSFGLIFRVNLPFVFSKLVIILIK